MNYKVIQNADPRPKRRRSKDNPYTLFTVGMQTGIPRYYVDFQASNGQHICLEIESAVFEAMNQFELDDLRFLNEVDNHYERSELTEASLTKRAATKPKDIDNIILDETQVEWLKKRIALLPPVQRRRFVLHYYGCFTYKQIAEMDGCSVSAVKKTMEAAKCQLKKMILDAVPFDF